MSGPAARPARAELDEWCRRWLGSPPTRVLFRSGNLSTVTGLRLADGRRVVIKARQPAARLDGCRAVQHHLARQGFPCPLPLAGPAPLGALAATAEEYLPGGRGLRRPGNAPRRFARALAWLVDAAPPITSVPSLGPSPAWLRWDHLEPGPWPTPESTPVDLNAHRGPDWLDEAAHRARARLAAGSDPPVIGHGDFESQNLRWRGGRLHAVHDWDSAVGLPETVLAGAAAAMFPATGSAAAAADIEATAAFLHAYVDRRQRCWSPTQWQTCWAAGLWVLAYNTKIELAEGRSALAARLAGQAARRLELAGA